MSYLYKLYNKPVNFVSTMYLYTAKLKQWGGPVTIRFVIQVSLIWTSWKALFLCDNWSPTLSLMIICVTPLIGHMERHWLLLVTYSYPGKSVRWTDCQDMQKYDQKNCKHCCLETNNQRNKKWWIFIFIIYRLSKHQKIILLNTWTLWIQFLLHKNW